MSNKFEFAPATLFVNGKTFPARYEIPNGQETESVYIYATVDGQEVKIEVRPTDKEYPKAAEAARWEPTQAVEEQPEPVQAEEEQPETEPAQPIQAEEEQPETEPAQPVQAEEEQPKEQPQPVQGEAEPQPEEQTARDPKQTRGFVPEKNFKGTSISGTGYTILFDEATQRTRVIVLTEYREKARAIIEEAGFWYSPSMDSWNKKLTFRAYRAAQALIAELEKALAA